MPQWFSKFQTFLKHRFLNLQKSKYLFLKHKHRLTDWWRFIHSLHTKLQINTGSIMIYIRKGLRICAGLNYINRLYQHCYGQVGNATIHRVTSRPSWRLFFNFTKNRVLKLWKVNSTNFIGNCGDFSVECLKPTLYWKPRGFLTRVSLVYPLYWEPREHTQ